MWCPPSIRCCIQSTLLIISSVQVQQIMLNTFLFIHFFILHNKITFDGIYYSHTIYSFLKRYDNAYTLIINNALKFTFRKRIHLSTQKVDVCRMYFTETPVYFPSAMYVIYSEFCCLQRFLLVNSMNK